MSDNINLGALFGSVVDQLSANKDQLNKADTHNHDHGDHMVELFQVIQKAVSKKSKAPVPEQLKYASQVVSKECDNGSAKVYAQNLSNAASQFSGDQITSDNIGMLVKMLLGADDQNISQNSNQLGSLLSGLTGGNKGEQSQSGFGADDLLRAGMAFFQSKQQGGSTQDALLQAVISASPLGQSAHRSQSGMLVASTLMSAAQSFMNK